MQLHDLNYRHLLYLHMVVTHGSVSEAANVMGVSQPTVSAQLRRLEAKLGGPLLKRAGRGVTPTELGALVAAHAEEMFRSAHELIAAVRDPTTALGPVVRVGVADVVPQVLTSRLLAPLTADGVHRVVVHSGHPTELLAMLAVHRLDVVLSDAPINEPVHHVRAYNHVLGRCGICFCAHPDHERPDAAWPEALEDLPMLVPTANTVLRRSLDHWLERLDLTPHVAAEVEDPMLLMSLAEQGAGVIAVPSAVVEEVCTRFHLVPLFATDAVEAEVVAITTGRRIRHPGVVRLSQAAAGIWGTRPRVRAPSGPR